MPLNVQCKCCANLRNDWCDKVHDSPDHDLIRDCQHYLTSTNADRIRAMSDEELAEWIAEIADCVICKTMQNAQCRHHHQIVPCDQAWLDWLRQEATDGV